MGSLSSRYSSSSCCVRTARGRRSYYWRPSSSSSSFEDCFVVPKTLQAALGRQPHHRPPPLIRRHNDLYPKKQHMQQRRLFVSTDDGSGRRNKKEEEDDDIAANNTANSPPPTPTPKILELPVQFLRDSDPSQYDPHTHQKINMNLYDTENGKPLLLLQQQQQQTNNRIIIRRCWQDKESNNNNDDHDDQYYYHIEWDDGLISTFSHQWVDEQLMRWYHKNGWRRSSRPLLPAGTVDGVVVPLTTTPDDDHVVVAPRRLLWTDLTEEQVRDSDTISMSFDNVLTESGMAHALRALYEYGILHISDTPGDEAAIAALASALGGGSDKSNMQTTLVNRYLSKKKNTNNNKQTNDDDDDGGSSPYYHPILLPHETDGPLRTLYGTVWSTHSQAQSDGSSVADSAYGCDSLPLHTDMTYLRDPPGLQIFSMIQSATKGGDSIFADGFAAAELLRQEDPQAFATLSQTIRRYRSIDPDTGWHLEASGPVIGTTSTAGADSGSGDDTPEPEVVMIRSNDLDRLPDLYLAPPSSDQQHEQDLFYQKLSEAHSKWDSILARDSVRLVMKLRAGDTMVVANQRCMHGRYRFETGQPRIVMGCYVSQDELNSRFRLLGFPYIH